MNISSPTDPALNTIPPEAESGAKAFVRIEGEKKSLLRWLTIMLIIVEVFLFFRTILELTGANPASPFAGFIYLISGFFLLPFWGIFPATHVENVSGQITVDGPALFAMISYVILVPVVMGIIWLFASILKGRKQVSETVKKNTLVDPTEVEHLIK